MAMQISKRLNRGVTVGYGDYDDNCKVRSSGMGVKIIGDHILELHYLIRQCADAGIHIQV